MSAAENGLHARVQESVSNWCRHHVAPFVGTAFSPQALRGKLLRTRFAGCLLGDTADPAVVRHVHLCCASTELVHAASLFHDDVVDGGTLRRGSPSLWRQIGTNTSILTGDLLLCGALSWLSELGRADVVAAFVDKTREMCEAEIEQELVLRGELVDADKCLAIARGKTGALFAFTAAACAGAESERAAAFEEAGYRVGTAYQLVDDLVDETCDEASARKSLGTDRLRRKFTLANNGANARQTVLDHVGRLCGSASQLLAPWPGAQKGLEEFVREYIDGELARVENAHHDAA